MPPFRIVLVAAGGSRRLGEPKQLLLYRGKPLVRHAAEVALEAGAEEVIVVLGASDQAVSEALGDLTVIKVNNERWEEGIGASIALGFSLITNDTEDCALMLGDQPGVTSEYLRRLREHRRRLGSPFAATLAGDVIGPPVVFARQMFDDLRRLSGDTGARALIRAGDPAWSLSFSPAAFDVDTKFDAEALYKA